MRRWTKGSRRWKAARWTTRRYPVSYTHLDVRARHVIVAKAELFAHGADLAIDAGHDALEPLVHLGERPGEAQAILAHFQRGNRHAARVRGLARGEQHARGLEAVRRVGRGGHVGALAHGEHAVLDQGFRVGQMQLVLRGAGQRHVAGHVPNAAGLVVLGLRAVGNVFADALALHFFDLLDRGQVCLLYTSFPNWLYSGFQR